MTKLLPLLFLLPVSAFAGKTGTIDAQPLDEGDRLEVTEDLGMEMTMTVKGTPMGDQTMEVMNHEAFPRTIEVVEVADGKVRVVRVTFGEAFAHQKMSMMGLDKKEPKPFAGQTFVVTGGDEITVTGEGGEAVSDEVAAEVRKKAKNALGSQGASAFQSCIPDGKLKVGVAIDMTECKDGVLPGGDAEVTTANLVLKKFKKHEGRKAAFFDLDMRLTGAAPGGIGMDMDVSGEVIIDQKTGFPLKLTMKGPISITGTQDGMELAGTGEMDMRLLMSIAR